MPKNRAIAKKYLIYLLVRIDCDVGLAVPLALKVVGDEAWPVVLGDAVADNFKKYLKNTISIFLNIWEIAPGEPVPVGQDQSVGRGDQGGVDVDLVNLHK